MAQQIAPRAIDISDARTADALVLGTADIAVSPASDYQVRLVTDLLELAALGKQWEALQAQSPATTVFQSHAQTVIWAQNFVQDGAELRVVTVYRGTHLVLILPLFVTRSMGIRMARVTGQPVAQYSDAIATPDLDVEPAFAAAFAALRAARIDVLALDRLRDDALLHRATAHLRRTAHAHREAPFADLTVAPDHASFVRGRSKNLLHNLRNRRKQADRAHQVTFEMLEGGADARAAMADAIDFKREWLVERGAMSTAFMDPTTNRCLLDLAERSSGALVARLLLDGEPAAIRFGFAHQGTYFAYMSAYNQKFSQFSPGKLLMDYCVAQIRDRGVTTLDMLPPAGEHKAVWCDQAVGVADYVISLTLAGLVHASVVRDRILPAMRWTWHHLPAAIRGPLARHFLKL